jgi:hypothetical protein
MPGMNEKKPKAIATTAMMIKMVSQRGKRTSRRWFCRANLFRKKRRLPQPCPEYG